MYFTIGTGITRYAKVVLAVEERCVDSHRILKPRVFLLLLHEAKLFPHCSLNYVTNGDPDTAAR